MQSGIYQVSRVKYNFDFDELFVFPIRVCDLTKNSTLSLSLFSMDHEEALAKIRLELFDKQGALKQGTQSISLQGGVGDCGTDEIQTLLC